MSLLFPGVYLLYFPIAWLLSQWLPDYASTFVYLIFLLPICVFDSKFNITGVTYYNVLRRERVMLVVNAASAGLSLLLTVFSVYILNSVFAVIATMSFVVVARSVWTECFMNRTVGVATGSIGVAELVLTIEFALIAYMLPSLAAFIIYMVSYAVYLLVFRRDLVITMSKLGA